MHDEGINRGVKKQRGRIGGNLLLFDAGRKQSTKT